MKKTSGWVAALLLVAMGVSALGQETQTESLNVQLDGRKTWTVRYGFGSPLALAGATIGAGQLTLDQTLAVDFTATALEIFRVEGHFDDQEPADRQSLSLYLDMDNVQGVVGDFTAPSLGSFFAGSRTMKGARVDVQWDGGTAVGIASQLSGVRDVRQFVGETAFGERTYAGQPGDEGVSYATSLEGLGYVDLEDLYVTGFTETRLTLATTNLGPILTRYGVEDLGPAFAGFAGRAVDADEVVVVGTEAGGQSLVLKVEPMSLVRETVREAIRAYNKTGPEDPVTYPFVVGSGVETEFLAALEPFAVLTVGVETHPISGLGRHRFYDLGQDDVAADSVAAAVRLEDEFVATTDPELTGYKTVVHATEGLLEVAFPESFFAATEAALRVSFAYVVAGGAYTLGMAVIPGSERVTMAGRVLERDVDYTIDYEYGLLTLVVEIGPNDPLVVEFERYGSPGGSGSYARTFYGATASLPLSEEASITGYALRAVDERASVTHPESVRVMPNAQTVVGVGGNITRSDFTADFDIGYTNDVFPYDDNQRTRTPNRINALAASSERVFVGTDAGFSAMNGGTWRAYDTASGLSGREVRAIAADNDRVYFGTDGGLTVVRLAGVSPLDKVANWSRYGERDGLDTVSVRALLLDGETLWIGTDGGLFRVGVAEIDDKTAWTPYENALLVGIRALCMADGTLYVGTTEGLVTLDAVTGDAKAIGAASAVADLSSDGETLYVAGEDGVRTIVAGMETGWIVRGEAVGAVEVVASEVFCGTSAGLLRVSDMQSFHVDWTATALCADGDALWVGTAGNGAGELLVWNRGASETVYDASTTQIDPWNPRVYTDSAAGDHTTTGWTARATFAEEGDGYSITGSVDRVLPGFRAIDSRGRTDAGGWSVTSDVDLGPDAVLSFEHEVRMSDIGTDDARTTADNRLLVRGSFGPEITLSMDYELEDTAEAQPGFERNGFSYALAVDHTLFDDALRLKIGWDEGMHWDDGRALRRETALSANATLEVLPELTTDISWRRPVRIIGETASGSERWDWTTSGAFDVAGFGVSAQYALDSSRSLPDGAAALVHKATLDVSATAFEFGAWSLAPTLNLEAGHEQGSTALSGRLGLRVGLGELSTRTTASVDVSGLGTSVHRWSEKLTASATYTGIEGLRPTVNYSGARTVTEVGGQGSKATTSHSLNGRLTWSGADGTAETLALTARLQDTGTASITIDNAFSRDVTGVLAKWVPALAEGEGAGARSVLLRTDLGAEWRRQAEKDDASWRAGVAADVAMSSTWSLSLGCTYRGGVRTSIDVFHGLVLEMTVAIDFER